MLHVLRACAIVIFGAAIAAAQATVTGVVTDETGAVLPGVGVRAGAAGHEIVAVTDSTGHYVLNSLNPGSTALVFSMLNFGTVRRDVMVTADAATRVDVVLHYVLNADVTVTGRQTFANLADAANPAENLVGIAQSASQGAITAKQLEVRPLSRAGEVLETVPGVIVSQHSGEGKANQYYLRGFNLDHGTDFATTVAGMPVNMPTHAHGQGYTDLNFLIPELVSGVQYSKGPYFAEQGDFATAGAAAISYANSLEHPLVHAVGGTEGYGRALAAGSVEAHEATMLGALEVEHNDGPWLRPDAFRKVNFVGRYSRGDAVNGLALTAMGYDARWSATDQIPMRAVTSSELDRFGTLDSSDGGSTSRYSASLEWQHATARALTKLSLFGIGYRLSLFSNFTYFLDDPVLGDQFQQSDRRVVVGGRLAHRRLTRWRGRSMQNAVGVQWRTDAIALALNHTRQRSVIDTVRRDDVTESTVGLYGENSTEWTSWLRSLAGVRADGFRFDVHALSDPRNGGTTNAGIVSPKGGIVVGPFRGTELYANAGLGFHSNDARGTTIVVDPATRTPALPVTPLARATGAELGVRTVAVPHLQSTLSVWLLDLASELVFVGDAGTTEAGRPSRRHGIELANYFHPVRWLTFDADLAWSRARFRNDAVSDPAASDAAGEVLPAGTSIPGSVETVASAGVTIEHVRRFSGSLRMRYFGPRPLVEDDSVRSNATTLVNAQVGYQWSRRLRVSIDALNLLNASDSDVDYYYASRLPGEPASGVDDIHFHPTLPRAFRVTIAVTP